VYDRPNQVREFRAASDSPAGGCVVDRRVRGWSRVLE